MSERPQDVHTIEPKVYRHRRQVDDATKLAALNAELQLADWLSGDEPGFRQLLVQVLATDHGDDEPTGVDAIARLPMTWMRAADQELRALDAERAAALDALTTEGDAP